MNTELRDGIIQYIHDEYVDKPGTVIDENTPLITSGLVDSFSLVSLKVHLEDKYGIQLNDDEATADAFETVARIMALVQAKQAAKG